MNPMKNEDIDSLWDKVNQEAGNGKEHWHLVCTELLYRAYIGSSGIPLRRFLAIEIPLSEVDDFKGLKVLNGFEIEIRNPFVSHEDFLMCVLRASSSDNNDIFTIVAKDIIRELVFCEENSSFVTILKERIEKWIEFFKSFEFRRMSETYEIGLYGELLMIKALINMGIPDAITYWNGPLKAAQDFQGKHVAIEVKTTVSKQIDIVNISSEYQLDDSDKEFLYLVAYRLERDNENGIRLPVLIDEVASLLGERQIGRYLASLSCMGYRPEDSDYYTRGYVYRECITYRVQGEFPRLLRRDVPKLLSDTKYKLSLVGCEPYITNVDEIAYAIREQEYDKD